jgi:hypothetical protein
MTGNVQGYEKDFKTKPQIPFGKAETNEKSKFWRSSV